ELAQQVVHEAKAFVARRSRSAAPFGNLPSVLPKRLRIGCEVASANRKITASRDAVPGRIPLCLQRIVEEQMSRIAAGCVGYRAVRTIASPSGASVTVIPQARASSPVKNGWIACASIGFSASPATKV